VAKATKDEINARIEEILRIRLDGAQLHDIVQYAAEKQWGVNVRQLRTYINRADDLLVERQERKRSRLIARHIAMRESLAARSINAADYGTALRILSDLAKLQDLYTDSRELRDLVKLATAQAERLRELEARLDTQRTSPAAEAERPADGPAGSDASDGDAAGGDIPA